MLISFPLFSEPQKNLFNTLFIKTFTYWQFYTNFMRKSSWFKKKKLYKQSLFSYRWFFLTAYFQKPLLYFGSDWSVEFVTVIRINNQHIYSEETTSQGNHYKEFWYRNPWQNSRFPLSSQNFVNSNKMLPICILWICICFREKFLSGFSLLCYSGFS